MTTGETGMLRRARRRLGRETTERRARGLVRRHLDLPSQPDRGVWAVTSVRDEADTIGHVLDHLLAEGVQRILVADHLSRDGTSDILAAYARRHPVTVAPLTLDGFPQGAVMTVLARHAARMGAEWIIPFDADELWFGPSGQRLADYLLSRDEAIMRGPLWDYLATGNDDPAQPNPFERINYRRDAPGGTTGGWFKVAFRAHRRAVLVIGNHAVQRPGQTGDGLVIAHYQFRSKEQFIRKVTQGSAAFDAAGLGGRAGHHWRDLAARQGDLDRLWSGLARDQTLPFDWWPVPTGLVYDPGCRLLRASLSAR